VIITSMPLNLFRKIPRISTCDMRASVAVWTALAAAAYALLAGSGTAEANIVIPVWTQYFTNPWKLVLYIALLNLPVNMFMYALFLGPAYTRSSASAKKAPSSLGRLYTRIFAAVIAVTAAGAAIDFLAFYEKRVTISMEVVYVLRDTIGLSIVAAVVPVFASIVICYAVITRLTWKASLAPAAAIAIVNVSWWYFSVETVEDFSFLPILLSFAILPVPFYFLRRWHMGRIGSETAGTITVTPAESGAGTHQQVGPADSMTSPSAHEQGIRK
jgi:hypothetical protein